MALLMVGVVDADARGELVLWLSVAVLVLQGSSSPWARGP